VTTPVYTTTEPAPAAEPDVTAAVPHRGKGWIDHWEPDDDAFWEGTGKHVARRNLVWSMFGEHLGFSVWVIWTIVVINLGNAGITMSVSEQFLLTLVPNLVGSLLRLPYTFGVPRFGGRSWTVISAGLLLIPTLLLAVVVPSGWLVDQGHGTQLWVLILCAATAGFGGGNFSSSMFNISFFYPERKKGWALGMNAAGGNVGVAVAQILVPLVIIVGVSSAEVKLPEHQVHLAYAGWVWVPFILAAAFGARRYMNSLHQAKADPKAYLVPLRERQTWIMSFLYVGTFGSFIGFSFALPLVIRNTFPEFLAGHPFIATYLAGLGFAGALIGSLARPLGGWLADRVGGAAVTFWAFVAMAVFTLTAIAGVQDRSFATFFGSYMVIFLATGIGNGSTYKQIPSIFATLGRKHAQETGEDAAATAVDYKRRAAAVIGIAGAVGAFGGVLIQVVLRQASLDVSALVKAAETPAEKVAVAAAHADWSVPALWVFATSYVVFAATTWFVYLRAGSGYVQDERAHALAAVGPVGTVAGG
jgi:MFS transporter, NNP family, nitrate/nitrite transporter